MAVRAVAHRPASIYASELNKQSRYNRIVSRAVNEHQLTSLVFYLIGEIALAIGTRIVFCNKQQRLVETCRQWARVEM